MRYDLYSSETDDAWRYVLGTNGTRPLHVICLNPHTATQLVADWTVAKSERVALEAGYDSFVMLNLYPVRSRNVAALPLQPEGAAFARNKTSILSMLKGHSRPHILAAWGNDIAKRRFLIDMAVQIVGEAQPLNPIWFSLGAFTMGKHPRHPSRASNIEQLTEFDAGAYISRFTS